MFIGMHDLRQAKAKRQLAQKTRLERRTRSIFAFRRLSAAHEIARAGNKALLTLLIPLLGDPNERVVRAAISGFISFGADAADYLLIALQLEEPIRNGARQVMERLGFPNKTILRTLILGRNQLTAIYAVEYVARLGPQTIAFLVSCLIQTLGGQTTKTVTKHYHLEPSQSWIRSKLCQAILSFGPQATPIISKHLDNDNPAVYRELAALLAQNGVTGWCQLFYHARQKRNRELVRDLARYLSPGDTTTLTLVRRLTRHKHASIRSAAIECLTAYGDKPDAAIASVLPRLADSSRGVAERAALFLRQDARDNKISLLGTPEQIFYSQVREFIREHASACSLAVLNALASTELSVRHTAVCVIMLSAPRCSHKMREQLQNALAFAALSEDNTAIRRTLNNILYQLDERSGGFALLVA